MSRQVYCIKLKKEAEGLDFQIYPGELGKKIFDNISKEAWVQWQSKQTMLINEHKLNMMNSEDRALLEKNMNHFLFEDGEINIEGFVPKSKS